MPKNDDQNGPEQKIAREFAVHLEKLGERSVLYNNEYGRRVTVVLPDRDFHHIGDRQTAAIMAQSFLRQSGNSTKFSEQVRWSGTTSHRGRLPRNDFDTRHVSPVVTFHKIIAPKRVKE